MSVDLHVHTTFSDGEHSPSHIMDMARARGITAIAITDHDSIGGLEEAFAHAGIDLISGVEFGVDDKDSEVHILGYLFDRHDIPLKETLENLRRGRIERNRRIIERLNSLGMEMRLAEVEKIVREGSPGRPHIASVMVEKGYVSSIREAFDKYLAKGAPAYVERERFGASDCIRLILRAHGVPVLAHPKFIRGDLERLVAEYVGYGLAGIEVYYAEHTEEEKERYRQLAEKHDLIQTGGTDFHGTRITPHVELGGTFVPQDSPDLLRKRWLALHGRFRALDDTDFEVILKMTTQQMANIVLAAWNKPLTREMILATLTGDKRAFAYCVGQEIVGYFSVEDEGDGLFIHSLILRSDMTGFGVGDILMERAIREAVERRLRRIRLNVQDPNVNAIHFYTRWGFRTTREKKNTKEMVLDLRSRALGRTRAGT